MIEAIDPFIGTDVTDLPPVDGLAASWWWPKPQIGNTHPGATFPFGMVSACAYSGGYPTGYGMYRMSTEGIPPRLYDKLQASGFTHFQQSGTGAIRKYYNYFRVTPMLDPLDDLASSVPGLRGPMGLVTASMAVAVTVLAVDVALRLRRSRAEDLEVEVDGAGGLVAFPGLPGSRRWSRP